MNIVNSNKRADGRADGQTDDQLKKQAVI